MSRIPAYVRLVSYHAVTRYVQCVLKIVVPEPDGGFADEQACAIAHCRAAGASMGKIKHSIYTPGIELAISLGVSFVGNGRFSVKIDPVTGVIITVLARHERGHRRMRQLTDRELRVKANKIRRKMKGRPNRDYACRSALHETEQENA